MAQIRFVNSNFSIGGQSVPLFSWSVTLSSQGSMATMKAETTMNMLEDAGVDVITLSRQPNGAPVVLSAGYNGSQNLLFTGVLDECEGEEGEDKISFRCRDNAAFLSDGKQTVAGLNYRNQTIGQIVTQIANKFNFTPAVTDPGIMAGPLMNGEHAFNPKAQTWWSLLQRLADDVGYEVFVTPDGSLYFGPEQNQGTIQCSWMRPKEEKPVNPLLTCNWKYNPRNNSSITVKVLSNTPQNAQLVLGQATAASQPVPSLKKDPGALLGKSPKLSKYGTPGPNSGGVKSTYYILDTGTDPELANSRAQAYANELAKRQIILAGSMEGLPDLKVNSHLQLSSGLFLSGLDFNVVEATHSFSMSEGFKTAFRALALVA